MKKPVHSSHLALRFYASDGWTKEILDKYVICGQVVCRHPDDISPYWTLDHREGSRFDIQRLYDNEISEVHRWYKGTAFDRINGDWPETELEYLEKMNG